MSITVRLWTDDDLAKVGKDRELTTIFLNVSTFTEDMIKHHPYGQRREYVAQWADSVEPVKFYATDDEMAIWFLRQEYARLPAKLHEEITTFRQVKLPDGG